jgi:uncharacterized zinc-type alcohol dehydrogenase-like protein
LATWPSPILFPLPRNPESRKEPITMPHAVKSYAADSPAGGLVPFEIDRPSPRADNAVINILYYSICHSDIHNVCNDWGSAQ